MSNKFLPFRSLSPQGVGGKKEREYAEAVGCAHRCVDSSVEGWVSENIFKGLPSCTPPPVEVISSLRN